MLRVRDWNAGAEGAVQMDCGLAAFVSVSCSFGGGRKICSGACSLRVPAQRSSRLAKRRGRVDMASRKAEIEEAEKDADLDQNVPSRHGEDESTLRNEEQAKKVIEESRSRVRALELRNWLRSSERVITRARRMLLETEESSTDTTAANESLQEEFDVLKDDLRISENVLTSLAKEDSPEVEPLLEETRRCSASLSEIIAIKFPASESAKSVAESKVSPGGQIAGPAGQTTSEPDSIPERVVSSATEVSARVRNELNEKVDYVVSEIGTLNFGKVKNTTQWTFDRAGETWSRLNGVGAKDDEKSAQTEAHAPLTDSELAISLRKQIDVLEGQLAEASKSRETMLRQEDQLGKLIRAKQIRSMDDVVIRYRRELAVRVLQLEMESIYRYLEAEVESAVEFLDVQLLIAEFGELDESLAELQILLDQDDALAVPDDDVGELAARIQFLKGRLGLEKDLYTRQLSWSVLKGQAADLFKKTKEGGDFLIRGFRLIGGDVDYASKLVQKASAGTVLTPREVRTMRRTARDLLTILPFTIIMIAPLTPVGHVLIFSFIQRFLPDFFPSTFSEQRIDFMKRYEKMQKIVQSKEQAARASGLPITEETGEKTDEAQEIPDESSKDKLFRARSQLRSYRNDLHLAE